MIASTVGLPRLFACVYNNFGGISEAYSSFKRGDAESTLKNFCVFPGDSFCFFCFVGLVIGF